MAVYTKHDCEEHQNLVPKLPRHSLPSSKFLQPGIIPIKHILISRENPRIRKLPKGMETYDRPLA